MIFHSLFGPAGVVLVGLTVLFGTFFLFRGHVRAKNPGGEGDRNRQLEAMIRRLQSEKEEVTTLLDEARRTTLHLSNMIDSFERTFYSKNPDDGSVTEIFNGLKRDLRGQTRHLEGRSL